MSNDANQLPAPIEPEPPEAAAEPAGAALTVQPGPPPEPPQAAAPGRSPGLILLAIFAALSAIAGAAYFMRERAPRPAAGAAPQAPAAVTIELPSAAAPPSGGAHDAPGAANPSPDKIFNDAASFKEIQGEADPSASAGFIDELPPAPHAAPGGDNNALIDAAKRALQDDDIDAPQTEDPEAALAPYDLRALAEREAAARRALAFSALAAKARAGAPYTDELRAYLAERQDRPLPALIADRAAAGVPSARSLAASFPDYHRDALAAGRRAEASGLAAKAGSSLASLVNLRPSGPEPGAATAAILSRVEAAVAADDLEAALREASALRPEAAARLGPWLRDAEARVALEAALRERESALHARLAGGIP